MKVCKIIAKDKGDCDNLKRYLEKYPVVITQDTQVGEVDIPTLIVGWSIVKQLYEKQNIFDKQIDNNLFWTYGKEEDEEKSNRDVEEFINKSIKKWLPEDFVLIDFMFYDKTLENFAKENIETKSKTYVYFNKGSLYLNNANKNYIINIKSLSLIDENYKKSIASFINSLKPIILSYKNLSKCLNVDDLINLYTFENIRWTKYKQEITKSYFNLIPGLDMGKYIPFIMSQVTPINFNEEEKVSMRRACTRDKITEWLSSQNICVKNEFNKQSVLFEYYDGKKLISVEYSNKRTLTGRIVPVGKYNPQNLPKNTDDRAQIVSRFDGGKVVVFDYTSFEARIGLYSCGNIDYIDRFKKSDLHYETAMIIFKKEQITKDEREFAKIINHSVLYGMSKQHILEKLSYLGNAEEIFYYIKLFLSPLLKKSEEVFNLFKEKGYIINNWGTIIYPEKDFATYNNYIQSSATEILVDKLYDIKKFLSNYKSKFLFQVHDSLVFDICPEEQQIVKELAKIIMNYNNKYFSLSYSSGYDYKNLSDPIEILDNSCF